MGETMSSRSTLTDEELKAAISGLRRKLSREPSLEEMADAFNAPTNLIAVKLTELRDKRL